MSERNWSGNYDETGNLVGISMDKFALQLMESELSGEIEEDAVRPIELFWKALRPQYVKLIAEWPQSPFVENPPDLPPEEENEFLERLANLEHACRIPYTPDFENWRDGTTMEQFKAGSRYIHIAAASALRHLKRDGYSDYVVQTIGEVRRALYLLGIGTDTSTRYEDLRGHSGFAHPDDAGGEIVALFAVRSLIHGILSILMYKSGQFEQAFKLAADAVIISDDVSEAVGLYEEYLLEKGRNKVDFMESDRRIRSAVERCTPLRNIKPQQVVDTFEGLKGHGKVESWWWVAFHCGEMIWHDRENLEVELVLDGDRMEHSWPDYWNFAKGWATAQLTPNEYRELRRRDEKDASEYRLRRYFFGDTWRNMPEKTRERLIVVDTLWFSESRGLDFGAILNELQVAVESMCYEFIWEPLRNAEGGRDRLAFMGRDAELGRDRKSPTLSDYSWACGIPFFKELVQSREIANEERVFLTSKLPSALSYLLNYRNPSQHVHDKLMRRDEIEPFIRLFLGIGREGIIGRLAEIGPKLARR